MKKIDPHFPSHGFFFRPGARVRGVAGAAPKFRTYCGPMMKLDLDFASQDFFRDPAAGIRRLQAAGPVVEVRFPIVGRVFMTTTQEMAARVLKDGRVFTLGKDDGTLAGPRWGM